MLAAMVGALWLSSPVQANLIVNGDFEAGNIGFSTDYTLGNLQNVAGSYIVINNPANAHPSAFSYPDHTTGSGLMLMANGDTGQGVVWRQTVAVTPGADYDFSMWISSWFFTPADIQLRINGVDVGPHFDAPSQHSVWQQYTAQWNAGASNSAMIELVNTSTHLTGNDFAFDDISFVPEPTSIALLGMTCLAALRRGRC